MFIVDCDCHNYWCDARVLEPYMDGLFKDMFVRGERTGPPGAFRTHIDLGFIPKVCSKRHQSCQ